MNTGCTATGVPLGNPQANDNCGIDSVYATVGGVWISPATYGFPGGLNTVVWVVTDNCGNTATCAQTVTVNYNTLTGTVTYDNTAHTPMDYIQMTIGTTTVTTDVNGHYSFPNLCGGPYTITFNTNVTGHVKTIGGVNSTDAAQVNYWGTAPYQIDKIKFYACDVAGSGSGPDNYLGSADAGRILQFFVQHYVPNWLDGIDWTFWNTTDTWSTNPITPGYPAPISTGPLGVGANVFNIYALCNGDFNAA